MNCPACGRALQHRSAGGVDVDACDGGCGGLWLDRFELRKLDEKTESAGESLLDVARDPSLRVDLEQRRHCPRCGPGMVMMRHFSSVRRRITVDECPGCGGVWLDAGELAGIREEFPSAAERQAAAEAAFAGVFDGRSTSSVRRARRNWRAHATSRASSASSALPTIGRARRTGARSSARSR